MPVSNIHVLGIGNAIVDVIARSDDAFLTAQALSKGSMALIDEPSAEHLYGLMGGTTVISGGSAANTILGVASLGLQAAFVGKVKSDPLGEMFGHDIRAAGVSFDVPAATDGPATARCLILVTPDGQRTMNTFLGACQNLTEADVDPGAVEAAAIVYLEGYLWDPPAAKAAFVKASRIARAAGRRVALSLSDSFCVGRYRDEFLGLLRDGSVQILFANEGELMSLYDTHDFEAAVAALRAEGVLGFVTRGADGALVVAGAETTAVPAAPVATVVDTTGAGDLFAAGALAGLGRDMALADCARLGALAAAEIIGHLGARPQADLGALARGAGFAL